MFPQRASDITAEHIRRLIENDMLEGLELEYKRELSMNYEGHPETFLGEVTSFANTRGGHLIMGVDEKDDGRVELYGIEVDDLDEEIGRWDRLLQDCVEPRLPSYEIVPVEVDDELVLVVQVPESMLGPHRINRRGTREFYGRSPNGKYPLDIDELREAFRISERRGEEVREFRARRIAKVRGRRTPVPIPDGPATVLHIIPYDAAASGSRIDPNALLQKGVDLPPFNRKMGGRSQPNLEGLICAWTGESLDEGYWNYTQLFRNGAIEAVDTFRYTDDEDRLPIQAIHEDLATVIPEFFDILQAEGITPPHYVFLSILDAKGYQYIPDQWDELPPLDRDVAHFPEVVIDEYPEKSDPVVEELMTFVHNAFGVIDPSL